VIDPVRRRCPDDVLACSEAPVLRTWADPAAYDIAARRIAHMFHENFEAYADGVSDAVRRAGPIWAEGVGEVKVTGPGEG
jgi:hypothetical protein